MQRFTSAPKPDKKTDGPATAEKTRRHKGKKIVIRVQGKAKIGVTLADGAGSSKKPKLSVTLKRYGPVKRRLDRRSTG